MISNIHDMKIWTEALARGTLISAASHAERLQYVDTGYGIDYGLGLFDIGGFIGHDGGLPGYLTLSVCSPSKNVTIIVLFNSTYVSDPIMLFLELAITIIPELNKEVYLKKGFNKSKNEFFNNQ